ALRPLHPRPTKQARRRNRSRDSSWGRHVTRVGSLSDRPPTCGNAASSYDAATMPAQGDIDRERLRRIADRERTTFLDAPPKTLALAERAKAPMPTGGPRAWMAPDNEQPLDVDRGDGSRFTDVDGHDYVDTNIADISMFCGYANRAIVSAVSARVAAG